MKKALAASFLTDQYHGYNVKFSPFRRGFLACATSENYGIAGKGRLYLLDTENPDGVRVLFAFEYLDGLYDVTWSEANQQLLVTSCGNGTIQLWDYLNSSVPVSYYKIHEKEVFSVSWNPKNAYPYILSSSWDFSVKVWQPFMAKEIAAFIEHTDQVYEAAWSPHCPEIFGSVSGDGTLRLWDMRQARSTGCLSHGVEVLCCDWAKDDPEVIATGTNDGKVIGWDIRKVKDPVFVLVGHEYAIRRLKFSPFERGSLASVSYDFTTRFWNWSTPYAAQIMKEHKEFAYGVDFNPLQPGQVCDCSWDSLIHIYNAVP